MEIIGGRGDKRDKKGNREAERRERERGKEGGRKKGGGRREKGMESRETVVGREGAKEGEHK